MRNLRRGFTLLELMIAITLMLIIMLMLRSMFVNAQTMYLRAAKRVDVFSQARSTMDMIEQDMMRLETGTDDFHSINMRSLTIEDLQNPETAKNSKAYSRLDDWAEPQDSQSYNIREFLSFTGRNTWYSKEEQKYVTGRAFVAYYVRRRLPTKDGAEYDGGYLVRRIMPLRSRGEVVAIQTKKMEGQPLYPSEDELASFVYGVRVFMDDQAAFQLGARSGNFAYNLKPECSPKDPNSWIWIEDPAAGSPKPQGGAPNPAVALQMPPRQNRCEFGGNWSTSTSVQREFPSSRWNYPSVVMFELTMIDRNFERTTAVRGNGTYRTFSRAVQLPVSGPMFRLDETDLRILLK